MRNRGRPSSPRPSFGWYHDLKKKLRLKPKTNMPVKINDMSRKKKSRGFFSINLYSMVANNV
jgi:hypothetical protein